MAVEALIAKFKASVQRWNDTRGYCVEDWLGLKTDDVKIRLVGNATGRKG